MGVNFENEEYDLRSDPFYCDDIETIELPKIKNGSILKIGRDGHAFIMAVDQHFNWFQKKMIKWCFGIKVRDYRG